MYSKLLIGQRTYPFYALSFSTGSALTAAHFWQTAPKVSKRSLPPRTALASLRFPHSGPAPWARRDGPSMAQHGSPGIHAGRPTPQNLHSASRWGGRSRSRSKTRSQADHKQVKTLWRCCSCSHSLRCSHLSVHQVKPCTRLCKQLSPTDLKQRHPRRPHRGKTHRQPHGQPGPVRQQHKQRKTA